MRNNFKNVIKIVVIMILVSILSLFVYFKLTNKVTLAALASVTEQSKQRPLQAVKEWTNKVNTEGRTTLRSFTGQKLDEILPQSQIFDGDEKYYVITKEDLRTIPSLFCSARGVFIPGYGDTLVYGDPFTDQGKETAYLTEKDISTTTIFRSANLKYKALLNKSKARKHNIAGAMGQLTVTIGAASNATVDNFVADGYSYLPDGTTDIMTIDGPVSVTEDDNYIYVEFRAHRFVSGNTSAVDVKDIKASVDGGSFEDCGAESLGQYTYEEKDMTKKGFPTVKRQGARGETTGKIKIPKKDFNGRQTIQVPVEWECQYLWRHYSQDTGFNRATFKAVLNVTYDGKGTDEDKPKEDEEKEEEQDDGNKDEEDEKTEDNPDTTQPPSDDGVDIKVPDGSMNQTEDTIEIDFSVKPKNDKYKVKNVKVKEEGKTEENKNIPENGGKDKIIFEKDTTPGKKKETRKVTIIYDLEYEDGTTWHKEKTYNVVVEYENPAPDQVPENPGPKENDLDDFIDSGEMIEKIIEQINITGTKSATYAKYKLKETRDATPAEAWVLAEAEKNVIRQKPDLPTFTSTNEEYTGQLPNDTFPFDEMLNGEIAFVRVANEIIKYAKENDYKFGDAPFNEYDKKEINGNSLVEWALYSLGFDGEGESAGYFFFEPNEDNAAGLKFGDIFWTNESEYPRIYIGEGKALAIDNEEQLKGDQPINCSTSFIVSAARVPYIDEEIETPATRYNANVVKTADGKKVYIVGTPGEERFIEQRDGKFYYCTCDDEFFPSNYVENAWWKVKTVGEDNTKLGIRDTALAREAEAFEQYIKQVTGQDDVTKLERNEDGTFKIDYKVSMEPTDTSVVKTRFNSVTNKYIVGPFKVNYLRAVTKQGEREKVSFSGISGSILVGVDAEGNELLDENGNSRLQLGKNYRFVYSNSTDANTNYGHNLARNMFDTDEDYPYPSSGEEFYIEIDYLDDLVELSNFKFDFQYLTSGGKYDYYTGDYYEIDWDGASEREEGIYRLVPISTTAGIGSNIGQVFTTKLSTELFVEQEVEYIPKIENLGSDFKFENATFTDDEITYELAINLSGKDAVFYFDQMSITGPDAATLTKKDDTHIYLKIKKDKTRSSWGKTFTINYKCKTETGLIFKEYVEEERSKSFEVFYYNHILEEESDLSTSREIGVKNTKEDYEADRTLYVAGIVPEDGLEFTIDTKTKNGSTQNVYYLLDNYTNNEVVQDVPGYIYEDSNYNGETTATFKMIPGEEWLIRPTAMGLIASGFLDEQRQAYIRFGTFAIGEDYSDYKKCAVGDTVTFWNAKGSVKVSRANYTDETSPVEIDIDTDTGKIITKEVQRNMNKNKNDPVKFVLKDENGDEVILEVTWEAKENEDPGDEPNPTGGNPTGGDPTGGDPTGSTPTGSTPTGSNPTGSTPTGSTPTGSTPTGSTPTGSTPTGSNPTGSNPTGSTPTGSTPTGSNPTGSTPTGSTPTGSNPTGSTPTGSTPTGSTPTGSNPTGSTPTGSNPTGSNPTGAEPDQPVDPYDPSNPPEPDEPEEATYGFYLIMKSITSRKAQDLINAFGEHPIYNIDAHEGLADSPSGSPIELEMFSENIDLRTSMSGYVWIDDDESGEGLGVYNKTEKMAEEGTVEIVVWKVKYEKSAEDESSLTEIERNKAIGWTEDSKAIDFEDSKLYIDNNGRYKIPEIQVPSVEGNDGSKYFYAYDVEFIYDGQNYEATEFLKSTGKNTLEEKIEEFQKTAEETKGEEKDYTKYSNNSYAVENKLERYEFDKKFTEIYGGNPIDDEMKTKGYATDGNEEIDLMYDGHLDGRIEGHTVESILDTLDDENHVYEKYRLSARVTEGGLLLPYEYIYHGEKEFYDNLVFQNGDYKPITEYFNQINFGLLERKVSDINVTKDVYETKLIVNDVETDITFNKHGDLIKKMLILESEVPLSQTSYRIDLYNADYYYRSDVYNSIEDEITKEVVTAIKQGTELRAFITYRIAIHNGAKYSNLSVNEFKDYYDDTLTLVTEPVEAQVRETTKRKALENSEQTENSSDEDSTNEPEHPDVIKQEQQENQEENVGAAGEEESKEENEETTEEEKEYYFGELTTKVVAESPHYRKLAKTEDNNYVDLYNYLWEDDKTSGAVKEGGTGDIVFEEDSEENGYKVIKSNSLKALSADYKKIDENMTIKPGEIYEIFVTYEVDKESYDNIQKINDLVEAQNIDRSKLLGSKNNIAEISRYSTQYIDKTRTCTSSYDPLEISGGIDTDSAPDNMDISKLEYSNITNSAKEEIVDKLEETIESNKEEAKQAMPQFFEDDTGVAPVLKFNVRKTEESRVVNGIVWDDGDEADSDSVYKGDEKGIKDAEVTMVEKIRVRAQDLKDLADVLDNSKLTDVLSKYNINDLDYEFDYVWPEEAFKSGDKHISKTNTGDEGEYTLYNYVAGNYIVKFDYGANENNIKYNGQDYKNASYIKQGGGTLKNPSETSLYYLEGTRDKSGEAMLNNEWHNLKDYRINSTTRYSDARDYEPRRLQVMAYSKIIANNNAEVLSAYINEKQDNKLLDDYKEKLKGNTEELIKNTSMNANTAKLDVEIEHPKSIKFGYVKTVSGSTGVGVVKKYNIDSIDFGVVRRPETKINIQDEINEIRLYKNDGTTPVMQVYMDEQGNIVKTYNELLESDGETEETEELTGGEVRGAPMPNLVPNPTSTSMATGIEPKLDTFGIRKVVEIHKKQLALGSQGFKYVAIEPDYLVGMTIAMKYKIKVFNNSDIDYTSYTVQKMQTPEELYDAAFKLETDKTYLTGLDITYGTYVGLYYYTGEVAIEEKDKVKDEEEKVDPDSGTQEPEEEEKTRTEDTITGSSWSMTGNDDLEVSTVSLNMDENNIYIEIKVSSNDSKIKPSWINLDEPSGTIEYSNGNRKITIPRNKTNLEEEQNIKLSLTGEWMAGSGNSNAYVHSTASMTIKYTNNKEEEKKQEDEKIEKVEEEEPEDGPKVKKEQLDKYGSDKYAPDYIVTTIISQVTDYIDTGVAVRFDGDVGKTTDNAWGDSTEADLANKISIMAYSNESGTYTKEKEKLLDVRGIQLINQGRNNVQLSINELLTKDLVELETKELKKADTGIYSTEKAKDEKNLIKVQDKTKKTKLYTLIDSSIRKEQRGSLFNIDLTQELLPKKALDLSYMPTDAKNSKAQVFITINELATAENIDRMNYNNMAEVMVYSNSVGRRDLETIPGNAFNLAKEAPVYKVGYNVYVDPEVDEGKAEKMFERLSEDYTLANEIEVEGKTNTFKVSMERDQYAARDTITFSEPTGLYVNRNLVKNIIAIVSIIGMIGIISITTYIISKRTKVMCKNIKKAEETKEN